MMPIFYIKINFLIKLTFEIYGINLAEKPF